MGVLWDHLLDEFDTGEFLSDIFLETPNDFRSLQENGRVEMVGVERFEGSLHIESNLKIIFCKFNHF